MLDKQPRRTRHNFIIVHLIDCLLRTDGTILFVDARGIIIADEAKLADAVALEHE